MGKKVGNLSHAGTTPRSRRGTPTCPTLGHPYSLMSLSYGISLVSESMDTPMLDLEAFRAQTPTPPLQRAAPLSIRRSKGQFIKGPIPMDWLIKAANLSGKTIHVALELWRESGCRRSRNDIPLSTDKLQSLGVGRKASYAALKHLEAAKLITVERRRGRLSRVTIIDVVGDDPT